MIQRMFSPRIEAEHLDSSHPNPLCAAATNPLFVHSHWPKLLFIYMYSTLLIINVSVAVQ